MKKEISPMNKMNSFKEHIKENYDKNELEDIAENIEYGIHGITYNYETSCLYDKFDGDIWDIVNDVEKECEGVVKSIFKESSCHSNFAYYMVLAAAKKCARELLEERDFREKNEGDK